MKPLRHYLKYRAFLSPSKGVQVGVLAGILTLGASSTQAQSPLTITPSTSQAAPATTEKGLPFAEILMGKGTNGTYILTKHNILADTLSIYANGRFLLINKDFWLDANSSTLYLPIPVPRNESVSVNYRYLEGPQKKAQGLLPGLWMNFGANTQLGLAFGTAQSNGLGMNTSTYGLSLGSKFGTAHKSSLRSMVYFSNTMLSDNLRLSLDPNDTAQPTEKTGTGAFIVQDVNLQSGNVKFRANFQDINEKFNGFQTLRSNFAGDKSALDELTLLEAEKGVKRFNFGVGIATGGKKSPSQGLQFDMNRLQDGNGSIDLKSVQYNSSNFSTNWSTREIGKDYQRFDGLREADKATWKQQVGMSANSFSADYRFGLAGKNHPTGSFGFASNRFGDETGSLNRSGWNYNAGNFGLSMTRRESDAAFTRIKDFTVGEKNLLLLDIYRQFDATAKQEAITDADRAQLAGEAGISRNSLQSSVGLGKQSDFQLGQLSLNDTTQKEDASFKRENLALRTKVLQFLNTHQKAGTNFSRFANLTDTERAYLVLDILRGYNPAGTLGMVTPNDRVLMSKSAGLERNVLRVDTPVLKGTGFSVSQINVKDTAAAATGTPAGMHRTVATLQTNAFDFSFLSRSTALGFSRTNDLTDIEKGYLALDIRKIYDPMATLEQVTPKEREQVAREVGVVRTGLQTNARLGKTKDPALFSLTRSTINTDMAGSDKTLSTAKAQRDAWRYTSKKFSLSFLNQSIDSNFLRLSELSDLERTYLGNERGLQKQNLIANWVLNKRTTVGLQHFSVANTQESVLRALDGAKAEDRTEIARKIRMGLSRTGLTVDNKGIMLAFNLLNTTKSFARSSDLAMTDPEKAAVEMARGFRGFDFALKGNLYKGLMVNLFDNQATNAEDALHRGVQKNEISYAPNKRTLFNYRTSGDMVTADGKRNGQETSFANLTQILTKNLTFNWTRDANDVYTKGDAVLGNKVNQYTLGTTETAPNGIRIVRKETEFYDGKFEDSTLINVKTKPSKNFSIGFTRQDTDRGDQGTEGFDALDFQWQIAKKVSILAGLSERNVLDPNLKDDQGQGDIKTYTLGIQGEPLRHMTLTAKFDEVHNITQNVKDVADISLSNTKPLSIGPLKDFVLTARYAALNDQRAMMNEVMSGRVSGKLWKNEFLLDYGGNIDKLGNTIARTFSFATDPNPKRWYRGSFYYKVRTMLDGQEFTIRRFTSEARLAKNTSISYLYCMLQEDERLQILPITTADVALKHAFRKGNDFLFFYRLSDNAATKIMTRSLGFGFEGQLDKSHKLSLSFSADGNTWPDRFDSSNHFRIGYEWNMSANRFLNLSADIKSHDAPNVPDEVMATIDFRFRF